MTLGDILQDACKRDLAHNGQNAISYTESVKNGLMTIKLESKLYPESFITCSIPYNGLEQEANYLRMHFLSMCFNAGILGMKRINQKKGKRNRNNNPN